MRGYWSRSKFFAALSCQEAKVLKMAAGSRLVLTKFESLLDGKVPQRSGIGTFAILWLIDSTGHAVWVRRLAGSAAADHASGSSNRAAHQYTDRTCNRSTNGYTCSRTGTQAAPTRTDGGTLSLRRVMISKLS